MNYSTISPGKKNKNSFLIEANKRVSNTISPKNSLERQFAINSSLVNEEEIVALAKPPILKLKTLSNDSSSLTSSSNSEFSSSRSSQESSIESSSSSETPNIHSEDFKENVESTLEGTERIIVDA